MAPRPHTCPSEVHDEESEGCKGKFASWKRDRDKSFHQASPQLLFITLASTCAWQCQHSVSGKYFLPFENTHTYTHARARAHMRTHMPGKGKKEKKNKTSQQQTENVKDTECLHRVVPAHDFSSSFPPLPILEGQKSLLLLNFASKNVTPREESYDRLVRKPLESCPLWKLHVHL